MPALRSMSPSLRLRVWGERACFARPEMKTERVSYDVMTPSAARGVLEAVLWKPQIRWRIERIDVLNPIRWDSVRRNEVGAVASVRNLLAAMRGGKAELGIDIETTRQQRAAVILRDVAYVIHARIALTERAGPEDTLTKYVEMFRRRAAAGQCFHRPYLGAREFAAQFTAVPDGERPAPIAESRDLGWMLFDIDHDSATPVPIFFEARLAAGSLAVPAPESPQVRR